MYESKLKFDLQIIELFEMLELKCLPSTSSLSTLCKIR